MPDITDLRQRHLEAYEEHYNNLTNDGKLRGLSRDSGAVVRAAIKAGWFGDALKAEAIDDMTGGEVRKLAKAVNEAYREATTIDPNS